MGPMSAAGRRTEFSAQGMREISGYPATHEPIIRFLPDKV
jgi:hypothetical protein